jgi:hypothetical protein
MNKDKMCRFACALAIAGLTLAPCLRADDTADSPQQKTDPKAAALARQKAAAALRDAITALAKEYEAHASNSTAPLRDKSNYFQDNPAPELTPDAVLNSIENVEGPPAEACYIKWQLLSGLPGKADDKLAPRLGDLYSNAPGPIPNPSLTPGEKTALASQIMRMTADQEKDVNDAWTKHLADWSDANAPILNYSEALYGLLPHGMGATILGFQDGFQRRTAQGVDSTAFLTAVVSDTQDWATTGTPEQLENVADQCGRLINIFKQSFPPSVYDSVKWNEKTRRLEWQPKPTGCLPLASLTALQKSLLDQARNPDDGIKMKTANQ